MPVVVQASSLPSNNQECRQGCLHHKLRMFDLESLRHVYLRRVVGTAAGALGFHHTARVGRFLGEAVHGLNTLSRRRAEARIIAALGNSSDSAQARAIVRNMYANWGRFWAEALFIPRLLRETSWRKFVSISSDDESTLTQLTSRPRGCIFAAGYFGNPAVLADVLGRFARPIHVVVDFHAQPQLRRWQTELYSRPYVRPIERAAAASLVPGILANGGSVLLIAEHERRKGRSVTCDYLGSRINAYPTIARLSRALDVPVAVVSCRRSGNTFSFSVKSHEVLSPQDMQDDALGTRRMLKQLENAALAAPEQYLWSMPIGIPLTQVAADVPTTAVSPESASTGAEPQRSRSAMANRSAGLHWNGNRIGVVPNHTSNRVGVAMAVQVGQMTAGGGSSGGN